MRPEGAGQIALLGPPNSGKSALHVRLTASHAHVADYPYTTQYPEPGMLPFEDIHFQLVDLPPVSPEHPVTWLAGALQTADACLLVVDLSDPDCVGETQALHDILRQSKVTLSERWERGHDAGANADDPFALQLPALLIANKADRMEQVDTELAVFLELTGLAYPALAMSAATGRGLGDLGPWLFRNLGVVRVYTKTPGHPPDRERPFTLRRGGTVEDVARLVHRDLVQTLRYARVWGKSGFDGQQIGREHVVGDGDVVELHS